MLLEVTFFLLLLLLTLHEISLYFTLITHNNDNESSLFWPEYESILGSNNEVQSGFLLHRFICIDWARSSGQNFRVFRCYTPEIFFYACFLRRWRLDNRGPIVFFTTWHVLISRKSPGAVIICSKMSAEHISAH